MIIKCLVLVILISALCQGKKLKMIINVTDEEYYKMPELFRTDDYDRCLTIQPKTLYCFTTIQLSPINTTSPSEVWKILDEVITAPRSFRHDQIRRGICIPETCPDIPEKHYTVGYGTNELISGINMHYNNKYKDIGLKASVIQTVCENETPFFEVDSVDILYAFVILSIIGFTILSSFIEERARQLGPEKYQQITEGSRFFRICACFSLPKNLSRLNSEITSSDGLALAPIQGIRVYNMHLVILSHTVLVNIVTPTINPRYIENLLLKPQNQFGSNGTLICETNLIIANLLLAYHFFVAFEKTDIKFKHLALALLNRWIRFAPLMLIVIGFNATWMRHIGDGPIWHLLIEKDYFYCRNSWLSNILFINNYSNKSDMCLQQTWYSAVDMQGFIVSLFLIMYILKKPQNASKAFGSLILLGVIITFVEHFYYGYDIVLRAWAENLISLFEKDEFWQYMILPGHHHLQNCAIGVACGFYFHKYRKENLKFLTKKSSLCLWLIFVWTTPLLTIMATILFHADGYEYTRFGAALYQATYRLGFGIPIAILIFGLIMGKGGPMRSICNWTPLHYLGRLTLCVYLVHTIPLKLRAGFMRTPIYVNDFAMIYNNMGDVFVSYILAAMVCLLFEMPITALQKLMSTPSKKAKIN